MAKIGNIKNFGADWAQLMSRTQWDLSSNNSTNVGELDPSIYTSEPNPDEGVAQLGVDGAMWQGPKIFGRVPAMRMSDSDDDSAATRPKAAAIDPTFEILVDGVIDKFGERVGAAFQEFVKEMPDHRVVAVTLRSMDEIAELERDNSPEVLEQILIDILKPDSELDNIPGRKLSPNEELWVRSHVVGRFQFDRMKKGDPDDVN